MTARSGVHSVTMDSVARITLSRPPHNFFDVTMISHIADLVERFDQDPSIRACVLLSDQKNFCAGADFAGGDRPDPKPIYDAATRLAGRRKPLIAAIRGAVVGGGLGLALIADFRVGATDCWFQANFVKIGLSPGFGITYMLPRLIGEHHARSVLITGRRIAAADAVQTGLLDQLVPLEELDQAAIALAREIAANSPAAVQATRDLVIGNMAKDYAAAVAAELAAQRPLFASKDFDEGVAAARERRTPVFADLPEKQA